MTPGRTKQSKPHSNKMAMTRFARILLLLTVGCSVPSAVAFVSNRSPPAIAMTSRNVKINTLTRALPPCLKEKAKDSNLRFAQDDEGDNGKLHTNLPGFLNSPYDEFWTTLLFLLQLFYLSTIAFVAKNSSLVPLVVISRRSPWKGEAPSAMAITLWFLFIHFLAFGVSNEPFNPDSLKEFADAIGTTAQPLVIFGSVVWALNKAALFLCSGAASGDTPPHRVAAQWAFNFVSLTVFYWNWTGQIALALEHKGAFLTVFFGYAWFLIINLKSRKPNN